MLPVPSNSPSSNPHGGIEINPGTRDILGPDSHCNSQDQDSMDVDGDVRVNVEAELGPLSSINIDELLENSRLNDI